MARGELIGALSYVIASIEVLALLASLVVLKGGPSPQLSAWGVSSKPRVIGYELAVRWVWAWRDGWHLAESVLL